MTILSRLAVLAACAVSSGPAIAGECPADKVGVDVTNPASPEATMPKGLTDTVLSAIDLAKTNAQFAGYQIRIRKLTIEPGGVVPWHSHADRPALIYIAQGEIDEYASNCSVPIVHKAGDLRRETSGTSHWWKNLSDHTVTLYVADVLHDKADHNM